MSDNDLRDAQPKHAADPEFPTFSGVLDEDLVTATDGVSEVVEMPREVFERTYAGFGWSLLDTTQPDPQWPTVDPDQPAWPATDPDATTSPWFTHTPAEESA